MKIEEPQWMTHETTPQRMVEDWINRERCWPANRYMRQMVDSKPLEAMELTLRMATYMEECSCYNSLRQLATEHFGDLIEENIGELHEEYLALARKNPVFARLVESASSTRYWGEVKNYGELARKIAEKNAKKIKSSMQARNLPPIGPRPEFDLDEPGFEAYHKDERLLFNHWITHCSTGINRYAYLGDKNVEHVVWVFFEVARRISVDYPDLDYGMIGMDFESYLEENPQIAKEVKARINADPVLRAVYG